MIYKSLQEYLLDLINYELSRSSWPSDAKFSNIKRLSIDQRGRVGEHFFKLIFKELNILDNYVDNSHGDWDIEANGLKIEVKTATLDVNNKFQHEGIKENKKWDVIAFLDIAQNDFYITFIHKNDFIFGIDRVNFKKENTKHGTINVYGKIQNIHCRGKDLSEQRATGAGYKVDLKINDLKIVHTIKDVENLFYDMKKKNNI